MRADAVASRWNAPGRWHKRLPRTRHYIGYLRELKEYIGARARAPEVDAPIARMVGIVETDLGLGLVSEKVVDVERRPCADARGASTRKSGFTPELYAALAQFLAGLLDGNVIVGDMHAWNIVYGSDSRGGPRLVHDRRLRRETRDSDLVDEPRDQSLPHQALCTSACWRSCNVSCPSRIDRALRIRCVLLFLFLVDARIGHAIRR